MRSSFVCAKLWRQQDKVEAHGAECLLSPVQEAASDVLEGAPLRFLGLSRCVSTEHSMSAKDTLATAIQLLYISMASSSPGI